MGCHLLTLFSRSGRRNSVCAVRNWCQSPGACRCVKRKTMQNKNPVLRCFHCMMKMIFCLAINGNFRFQVTTWGSSKTILLDVCINLGKQVSPLQILKQQERRSTYLIQLFCPRRCWGITVTNWEGKKRGLVDFCCVVPVMLISCRRCRGLFIAQGTSKLNIGYLVRSTGSCLSVMMVEYFSLAWRLTWGTILTLAQTFQN